MALIIDPDSLNQGVEVTINTSLRQVTLNIAGNLSNDGVLLQTLYSFLKEEWKSDPLLIPHDFPMIPITDEQFEFVEDWEFINDTSRKLVRTGGWSEIDANGVLLRQYAGVLSLGAFEDSVNDLAHYRFGNDPTDLAAGVDFDFAGPINEVVLVYDQATPADPSPGFNINDERQITRADGGNWETDGYLVGGQVTVTDAEDATNNGTFLLRGVGSGVDGVLDVGTVADAIDGFDFVDNGASPDSITRVNGSWIDEGYYVGGTIEVANATVGANNGVYTILALSDQVIDVPTGSLTADTVDLTATFGPMTVNAADTTVKFAVDNRNVLTVFIRVRDADPNGKTYAQQSLSDIGETATENRVFRFPLSNATDLNISETDVNIDANSPYTEIQVRYFDEVYNRNVDIAGARLFGVLVDVGTYSMPNGVSAVSALFTSAALSGITLGDYTGGTLTIHEGADAGIHTIVGTPVNNAGVLEVTVSVALTAVATNLSFTLQRTAPVTATIGEIYEKVQRELRRAADIDSTLDVVTGRTADGLLVFEGPNLKAGSLIPVNPNGGGSGVIIEGFDSNDTNSMSFFDNGGVERAFPFVAAGTINFNDNLVNDSNSCFWMFFEYTARVAVSDLAISGASGSTASIDSAGANLPVVVQNDYINILGAADPADNGIWQVTDATPTTSQFDATKVNGDTVSNETAFAGTIDENPINSPDALLVEDNLGVDIEGPIGASSIGFDFDYDGNVQGGRSSGTDAVVVLKAIGEESGQYVETSGIITRNTGLVFSLVAALERNYTNP